MKEARFLPLVVTTVCCLCVGTISDGCKSKNTQSEKIQQQSAGWVESFDMDKREFSSIGKNDYFILEPGFQLILEGIEGDDTTQLVITVLNNTQLVEGIETRIVEERETVNGELKEISRNFFAICTQTKDVFYFGEDVDIYEDGEIVSHESAWKAGVDNARAGMFMPGVAKLGMKYYQEIAPGVAMDRAEIVSDTEILQTPAGRFEDCLKTEETTPLEPGVKEYKFYYPGIGLVQDGDLLLTEYKTVP